MNRQAILYTLVLLVIFGCTPKDEALDSGLNLATAEFATTCNCQSCLYTGATMTQGKLSCCVGLLAAISCATQPPKPPVPDAGTGGSYSTGGSAGTGGRAATGGMKATGGTSGQPGPVTIETKACANLTMLACSEGLAPNCVAVLTNADTTRIENYDPKCLSIATSKAAVRKCGSGKTKCQ